MYADISATLRTTLLNAGTPPDIVGLFDRHASIELAFDNSSPIVISAEHNRVWMWSEITLLNASNIGYHAASLIDLLQHALPGVVTGQAVLGKRNDHYELKALLDDECVAAPDRLHEALDTFHSVLASIYRTLN